MRKSNARRAQSGRAVGLGAPDDVLAGHAGVPHDHEGEIRDHESDVAHLDGVICNLALTGWDDAAWRDTERTGWDGVVAEIIGNQTEHGEAAGITATDFARFQTLNDQFAQIADNLPAAEKLVEILLESKANIDNQRQRLASAFAQSAETRAKASGGDPTLLAKYEKTRAYRSAIAEKGARTRRKNAEAAKPAGGGVNGHGGGTPTP